MYYNMFTISFFLGMVLFILSFFVKNKHERVIVTGISSIVSFILAFASFDVSYISNGSIFVISEYYVLPSLFVLIGIIQLMRIFAVPYEDGENDG